jgi:hypothetical protein
MFEIVVRIIFVLFALVGIAEVFRLLLFWLFKTKKPGRFCLVLSFRGHDEEAEIALRSAMERVKWMGCGDIGIFCVDCGMDGETRRICELLAEEYPQIRICIPSDLNEIVCM